MHLFPSFLGATTMPAHQSVGPSTLLMTPELSMHWSSSFTFAAKGSGILLGGLSALWRTGCFLLEKMLKTVCDIHSCVELKGDVSVHYFMSAVHTSVSHVTDTRKKPIFFPTTVYHFTSEAHSLDLFSHTTDILHLCQGTHVWGETCLHT